ncbi:membrane-bound PQQ-dependent dehydrogenase, glucose/quinate/shikimate family [Cognatiluteimonas lumbrici]|uniref:membrane-bound PQQ-dependent dehydrogenase, glucose/quinate/shikimate family n=1 Tax=Cognatiluteimonas lumbrici TaxID=2559601 RepID=UPI001128C91A|nr:membrane-bound PQQ-dependent dehydrogenase, glucose/quinate/shikimate family [Luteimonas lumbrici]
MANETPGRRAHPWITLLGVIISLAGLTLAIGGGVLLAAGGSWYYLPAGLGLLVSGVLLARGRAAGAWWYWGVLAGTFLWTAWESGLDYWRWVPRVGLFVALGILVALAQWRLPGRFTRGASRGLAVALVGMFVLAFALAFVPYGVTPAKGPLPQASSTPGTPSSITPQADGDWLAYGRGYDALRYTPLAQIDRSNVHRLERAWVFHTGDLPDTRWGAETTPLKVGDTLYLCSARNILFALDARTGEQKWKHDPQVQDEYIPYTAACRGVAYYTVAATGADATCATRIVEGTLDGRLVVVDARTGLPCAGFGDNGQVSITEGMGPVYPGMVSITSPPVVVRGVIVTGHQVLDGQKLDAPSGVIQGFDAETGELRWAWDMTHPDWTGAPPDGEVFTRGTPNMWTIASADEQLGLVYLPMGNSAVDYLSATRSAEENRYATSLVALDVATGKPRWHFQTVHMDVWDYDLGGQGSLVDFPTAGGRVPAIVLPSKQGDIYVLDRRTGEPLVGVEERPAPQGGVEPAQRTATQPHSTYHTLRKRDLTERDMWGLTPIDQMICRIQFANASYDGFYTPPVTGGHSVQYPGYNGGTDWGGIAIDPRRGIIVANYNDMPNYVTLVPRAKADEMGWAPRSEARGDMGGAEGAGDPQAGAPYAVDVNAGWRMEVTGLLCKQPPYGGIRAMELATGRTLWDRPFGTARRNGPFGIPSMLPIEIGTPNNGGAVITASGLVFIAAATDDLIRAIDIDTGETVWSDALPAGGQATPMVYAIDGREYLVIMAGGHHFMETPRGDALIAYALPRRDQ